MFTEFQVENTSLGLGTKIKQSEELTMLAYLYACAFNEEYQQVLKYRNLIRKFSFPQRKTSKSFKLPIIL